MSLSNNVILVSGANRPDDAERAIEIGVADSRTGPLQLGSKGATLTSSLIPWPCRSSISGPTTGGSWRPRCGSEASRWLS